MHIDVFCAFFSVSDIFQSVYLRLQSHGIGDDLQTVVEILLESANVRMEVKPALQVC